MKRERIVNLTEEILLLARTVMVKHHLGVMIRKRNKTFQKETVLALLKIKLKTLQVKRVDQGKIMMKIEAKKKIGYIKTVANQIKPRKIPTRGEEVNLQRKLTEKKRRDVRMI